MKIISCTCFKDCTVEYCNENYPESYYLGKYNISNDDKYLHYGVDYCPICNKHIEISND